MKSNSKEKISNYIKGFVIFILVIILIINLSVIIKTNVNPSKIPDVIGYKPFIVLSGSMQDEIDVGDLVIVKNVDAKDLKEKDIIAYRTADGFVTTHRIINVINKENDVCFETKGDNNNTKDDVIVCSNSIEGKYQFKISKLGNVILFIQEPLGFTIMMLVILIICILVYMVANKKKDKTIEFASEEEMKEFEEFKKAKERKLKRKLKKEEKELKEQEEKKEEIQSEEVNNK